MISGLFDLIDTGLSEPGHAPSAWDPSNGGAQPQPPVAAQHADADRELLPAALIRGALDAMIHNQSIPSGSSGGRSGKAPVSIAV